VSRLYTPRAKVLIGFALPSAVDYIFTHLLRHSGYFATKRETGGEICRTAC